MSREEKRITEKTVEGIALLSRIELREGDREKFADELGRILDYVESLNMVDTEGVEPFTGLSSGSGKKRCDEPGSSLPIEEVLKLAPDKAESCFRMPRILSKKTTT